MPKKNLGLPAAEKEKREQLEASLRLLRRFMGAKDLVDEVIEAIDAYVGVLRVAWSIELKKLRKLDRELDTSTPNLGNWIVSLEDLLRRRPKFVGIALPSGRRQRKGRPKNAFYEIAVNALGKAGYGTTETAAALGRIGLELGVNAISVSAARRRSRKARSSEA